MKHNRLNRTGRGSASDVVVSVLGLVITLAVGLPLHGQSPNPPQQSTPESVQAAPPQASPVPVVQRRGKPYIVPAGRSPIPQPGERFIKPIKPKRLAREPEPKLGLPAPEGPVPWTQARNYFGRTITVEGEIVVTNNIGRLCFLNFSENWQGKFYLVVYEYVFEELPEPPETYYLNKKIHVTGEVELHRGTPHIKVRRADQIKFVE